MALQPCRWPWGSASTLSHNFIRRGKDAAYAPGAPAATMRREDEPLRSRSPELLSPEPRDRQARACTSGIVPSWVNDQVQSACRTTRVKERRRTELRANLDQSTAPAIPDSIHTAGQRLRAKLAIALEKPMAAKQRQVLLLMAEGTTDNESLPKQLSLSTRTIERYRQNLLRMFD